jgi:hypothetical protein
MTPKEIEQAEHDELDKHGVLKFAELSPVRSVPLLAEAVLIDIFKTTVQAMRDRHIHLADHCLDCRREFRWEFICPECEGIEIDKRNQQANAPLERLREKENG